MDRAMAIQAIIESVSEDDLLISTTGLISREVFEKFDSDRCFYVPGSMGLVSSIGLGLALSTEKQVFVIDGDASLLMNFGTLVSCGKWLPKNFTHIVIDNEAYGSCSEESSMSKTAHFDEVAKTVGYAKTYNVSTLSYLKRAIIDSQGETVFIRVAIQLGGRRDFARPLNLPGIKGRFMDFVKRGDDNNDVPRQKAI